MQRRIAFRDISQKGRRCPNYAQKGDRPRPQKGDWIATAAGGGRSPFCARSRTAFTLFEMLLVLGVLAVIMAVAWPNVIRLSRQQTLMNAADKVRGVAASARVHAIESGLVYQFRYEPGGQHFLITPFERESEAVMQSNQGTGTASGLGRFSKASGTLPTSIKFVTSTANVTTGYTPSPAMAGVGGQQISAESLNGLPDANKLASVAWSGPILFHPNGSAIDAAVDLVDKQNQHIMLHIRGITGGVSVTRPHRQAK